jgi:hypothetical protein
MTARPLALLTMLILAQPVHAGLADLTYSGSGNAVITASNPGDPVNAILPPGMMLGSFANPAAGNFTFMISMVLSTDGVTGTHKYDPDGGFQSHSACSQIYSFSCLALTLPEVSGTLRVTDSTGARFSAAIGGGFSIFEGPTHTLLDPEQMECRIAGVPAPTHSSGWPHNCNWQPNLAAPTKDQPHVLTQAQFDAMNDPWAYLLDGLNLGVTVGTCQVFTSCMDGTVSFKMEPPASVPEPKSLAVALGPIAALLLARRRRPG